MRTWRQALWLSPIEVELVVLSRRLSRLGADLLECLEPRLPEAESDRAAWTARLEFLRNLISISLAPVLVWRLVVFGHKTFQPYWLDRPFMTPATEAFFRTYCSEEEARQLHEMLYIDRRIREIAEVET